MQFLAYGMPRVLATYNITMNIIAISGSLRNGSDNTMLGKTLAKLAPGGVANGMGAVGETSLF